MMKVLMNQFRKNQFRKWSITLTLFIIVVTLGTLRPSSAEVALKLFSLTGGELIDANLRRIEPNTGETISLVPIQLSGETVNRGHGFATHPTTGELWALLELEDQPDEWELVTINPDTGVASSIGNTGDKFAGLAFDSAGTLYGVTGDGAKTPATLFTLSTTNAAPSEFLALNTNSFGEAIAFNPSNGLLYHGSGAVDSLPMIFEAINLKTKARTNIPLSGEDFEQFEGLTHKSPGTLLLSDGLELFQITISGAVTPQGTTDHHAKALTFLVSPLLTWDGGGDGSSWHDAANWEGDSIPGPSDEVLIRTGFTVIHSEGSDSIKSLTCDSRFILTGGSLSIAARSTISGGFTLKSTGELAGAGDVIVSGLNNWWFGGTMSGSGKTLFSDALNIGGSDPKVLSDGRILENEGAMDWHSGDLTINPGTVIHNLPAGTFNAQNEESSPFKIDGGGTFNNKGVFRKSTETSLPNVSATNININFKNTGIGTIENRTDGTLFFIHLTLSGGAIQDVGPVEVLHLTWTGGTMTGSGKTIVRTTLNISGSAPKTLSARTIENQGTANWSGTGNIGGSGGTFKNLSGAIFNVQSNASFSADIVNAGQVAPGGSSGAGILSINGAYIQEETGVLNIEIGGLGAGAGYDQLRINGAATLAGTLNIILLNNFVPQDGNSFEIITFNSKSGGFTTITGSKIGYGLFFDAEFGETGFVITVDSDLSANFLTFEPTYFVDDYVKVKINLRERIDGNMVPLLGATVNANITRPDANIDSLALNDAGTAGDSIPSDGIYTGTYTKADIPGAYLIIADVSGVASTGAFNTQVKKTIQVIVDMPPIVSNVMSRVTAVRSTSVDVEISWDTDEPATAQVEYGLATNYGHTSTLDTSFGTRHIVSLIGLSRFTTYHYRVRSEDTAGNETVSNDYLFFDVDVMLTASDITFTAKCDTVGDTIAVRAMIHNLGPAAVNNITVRFFDGDPDNGGVQLGQDQKITSIDGGGDNVVEVCCEKIGKSGYHDIYVVVDPDNAINEGDETNNKASKGIWFSTNGIWVLAKLDVVNNTQNAPVFQVTQHTTPISSLDIDLAIVSTIDPADITRVKVIRDDDGDGLFDPGESILGETMANLPQTITLTPALAVGANGLIVFDLAGTADDGENFKVIVTAINGIPETETLTGHQQAIRNPQLTLRDATISPVDDPNYPSALLPDREIIDVAVGDTITLAVELTELRGLADQFGDPTSPGDSVDINGISAYLSFDSTVLRLIDQELQTAGIQPFRLPYAYDSAYRFGGVVVENDTHGEPNIIPLFQADYSEVKLNAPFDSDRLTMAPGQLRRFYLDVAAIQFEVVRIPKVEAETVVSFDMDLLSGRNTTLSLANSDNSFASAVLATNPAWSKDAPNQSLRLKDAHILFRKPTLELELVDTVIDEGDVFDVNILIDTKDTPIVGVDLFVKVDKTKLDAVDQDDGESGIQPFSPGVLGGIVMNNIALFNLLDPGSEDYSFRYTEVPTSPAKALTGRNVIATLRLKALPGVGTSGIPASIGFRTSHDYPCTATLENGNLIWVTLGEAKQISVNPSIALSGKVHLEGRELDNESAKVEFEIRDIGQRDARWKSTVKTASDGAYALHVYLPKGKYDVTAKAPGYLRGKLSSVAIPGTADFTGANALLAGDVNDDNSISLHDFTLLAQVFGSSPSNEPYVYADFTKDGFVTLKDFSLLGDNFGMKGEPSSSLPPASPQIAGQNHGASLHLMATMVTDAPQPEIEVSIIARKVSKLRGYSCLLRFDHNIMEIVETNNSPRDKCSCLESDSGSTLSLTKEQKASGMFIAGTSVGESPNFAEGEVIAHIKLRLVRFGPAPVIALEEVALIDIDNRLNYLPAQRVALKITPQRTQLLPNFPNPFNPETWIPFALAENTPVRIRIYAANGQLVRTLNLGYREPGFYYDKKSSAHWDGKNIAGEQVASGMYFYHLHAGSFSAMRKMVIVK